MSFHSEPISLPRRQQKEEKFLRKAFLVMFGLCLFFLLAAKPSFAATNYTVRPGDTLYLISQSYGLTSQALAAANGLNSTDIYPGQVFTIPVAGSGSQYTVRPGDTLYLIAQAHGTTVDNLMAVNNLSGTSIYPGQILNLPTGAAPVAGSGAQYTVRPSDTLYLIAQAHGTTVDNLMAVNNLNSINIYPGQVLLLPGSSVSSSTVDSSRSQATTQDSYLLAQLIRAEAQGESFEGQVAVGAVVLNRLRDPRFPKTISGVIYDQWQFEPVTNGTINQAPDASARKAADAALTGWDPTGGALYFYNPDKVNDSYFTSSLTYVCLIGNHVYYKL
jgi:N-acetylmuramoyl-L-alanine amidase